MRFLLLLLFFIAPTSVWANFESPESFLQDPQSIKALIFLSKDCPCSRSHVEHLEKLSAKHPSVHFYGVISQAQPPKEGLEYFKNLKIPVIKDPKQVLVKRFKALKTPHVTLFKNKTIVYEGGVSNSRNFKRASKHFLKESIEALVQGAKAPYRYGESLGCYIKREED